MLTLLLLLLYLLLLLLLRLLLLLLFQRDWKLRISVIVASGVVYGVNRVAANVFS